MVLGREMKVIGVCVVCAMCLMLGALFTVNSSFAITASNDPNNWHVYFDSSYLKSDEEIEFNNNMLNFSVELYGVGDEFRFTTSIKNAGTYDAYLSELKLTDLNNIVVGKSYTTGKTYTAADYVSFQVINLFDNEDNDIVGDTAVKKGDLLHMGTDNKILVSVKLRSSSLDADMIDVLKDNNNRIRLDLSIIALYQQKM